MTISITDEYHYEYETYVFTSASDYHLLGRRAEGRAQSKKFVHVGK